MEPWDGPAAIAFTDGTLRSAPHSTATDFGPAAGRSRPDGLVVLASETGVTAVDSDMSASPDGRRLRPGELFLVDTEAGRIIPSDETKIRLAKQHPVGRLARVRRASDSPSCPSASTSCTRAASVLRRRQRIFGYTDEELRHPNRPRWRRTGPNRSGAMGSDTPIAVLSDRPRLLFDYFTQTFAQVTNPPLGLDPRVGRHLRKTGARPVHNLLTATPQHTRLVALDFPVIDNDELAKIQHIEAELRGHSAPSRSRRCTASSAGTDAMRSSRLRRSARTRSPRSHDGAHTSSLIGPRL